MKIQQGVATGDWPQILALLVVNLINHKKDFVAFVEALRQSALAPMGAIRSRKHIAVKLISSSKSKTVVYPKSKQSIIHNVLPEIFSSHIFRHVPKIW
jgi:hypothetical protein